MTHDDPAWAGLVGAAEADLVDRFGAPRSRRADDGGAWLMFDAPAGRLRVRCAVDAAGTSRVASWTVTFSEPHASLSSAASAVGLWPDAAPDASASDVVRPLVRRELRRPDAAGVVVSLTATVRGGRFDRLSVFDEPPEWS